MNVEVAAGKQTFVVDKHDGFGSVGIMRSLRTIMFGHAVIGPIVTT